jgi:ABC-type uncharacterized transport system ATPase subunit
MIRVRDLYKHYRVHERPPGVPAAIRSIFRRSYKTIAAVDGIDFDIGDGERGGFLGPNGAGKTTTLKVLAGLLHPTRGEVTVDGHEPRRRHDDFLKKIMLVLGQKQQLLCVHGRKPGVPADALHRLAAGGGHRTRRRRRTLRHPRSASLGAMGHLRGRSLAHHSC